MSGNTPVTQRMRIAVLNRHFGYRFGGAERYAAAVVEELAAQHEVHVFAQEIEHAFPGVTYHRISRPVAKPRWVNQLWFAWQTWLQTRKGFDIVHSHENTWHGDVQTVHVRPFRVGLVHGRTGIRRTLKWLSLLTSPRLLTYWWLEAARLRPHTGKHIVATSEQVRMETLSAYPNTSECIHVMTPGVNLPHTPPDPVSARQQLALPQNVSMALFVGNDYAKKGLCTLLQALTEVPALHLAVVGNGQQLGAFKRQAQQLQVAEQVHFLGSLPDVTPAYCAANFLVHPTTEDTYAMVVLEAMACELPVIVSSAPYCGITAELTHNTQALILDNPRDAGALARLLTHLLDSAPLQRQLKSAGRQFASERSWHSVCEKHEQLFQQIMDSRSA